MQMLRQNTLTSLIFGNTIFHDIIVLCKKLWQVRFREMLALLNSNEDNNNSDDSNINNNNKNSNYNNNDDSSYNSIF